jgi:hypothetical protein
MFRLGDRVMFSFTDQNMGYVKGHSHSPPYFMQLPQLPRVPGGRPMAVGDEFIGTLAVDCPLCEGATLVVYFLWGSSGWFYKVPSEHGRLLYPADPSVSNIINFTNYLQGISTQEERITITAGSIR